MLDLTIFDLTILISKKQEYKLLFLVFFDLITQKIVE